MGMKAGWELAKTGAVVEVLGSHLQTQVVCVAPFVV